MPPKPRTLSVSKQCEECGGSSPVACKSCKTDYQFIIIIILKFFIFFKKTCQFLSGTVCGADFYNSSLDKADSPGVPSETGSDAPSTPSSERRTTRRRDKKPDYYNALDFDARRREKYVSGGGLGTPTRPKRLVSDKIPYRPARFKEDGGVHGHEGPHRGRPRKHPPTLLKRKKSRQDDDDDHDWGKKKKKRKHHHKENKDCSNIKEGSRDSKEEEEEELTAAMDDLPPEKTLQCQVGLAEINRKLGVVMCQPL